MIRYTGFKAPYKGFFIHHHPVSLYGVPSFLIRVTPPNLDPKIHLKHVTKTLDYFYITTFVMKLLSMVRQNIVLIWAGIYDSLFCIYCLVMKQFKTFSTISDNTTQFQSSSGIILFFLILHTFWQQSDPFRSFQTHSDSYMPCQTLSDSYMPCQILADPSWPLRPFQTLSDQFRPSIRILTWKI